MSLQVLFSLRKVHSRGLVHGNVTLETMRIKDYDGDDYEHPQFVLSDFGAVMCSGLDLGTLLLNGCVQIYPCC
jgi:hypothetical protein